MQFCDSRRLTGPNVYFKHCGAVLEALGDSCNRQSLTLWKKSCESAFAYLAWPIPQWCEQLHQAGATLGFTAPLDQLLTATEINEWAWLSSINAHEYYAPGHLSADTESAMQSMIRMAKAEAEPELLLFIEQAVNFGWPILLDEETLSVGFGAQTQIWPRHALPDRSVLQQSKVKDFPIAMVTGSNGKTTSVRLLAAIARADGLACTHNCTDGLFFNGELVEADDYSGPAGARASLRHPKMQAAILETARGGLLRRGLACTDANVALVTNISEDHFGEYGVFSLDDLARVKLSIAKGLKSGGLLVLNASDPMLLKHGDALENRHAWFAGDWNNPKIQSALTAGNPVCAVSVGRVQLSLHGKTHDLGAVNDMPLSFSGLARYNIENITGASLAAALLGFSIDSIKRTLHQFGSQHQDNPGRLQSWLFGDVRVLMDYAHNPEGMYGFLSIAKEFQHHGRLAVLLGQAGNRENADIEKLAVTVASFNPDLVLLKDMLGYERGRAIGEVPEILKASLLKNGLTEFQIEVCLDEIFAVRKLLQWAQTGDVLALPVHGLKERQVVQGLLEA
ncbi:MAG TPA: Mur ligase family protein, partial [Arenimonas sp.]|nr:Mur ligase family protein [Arenimonas sp.]